MKDAFGSKFWNRFHAACKEKRRSRAWVAAELGVKYSTFCGWIDRKHFCRPLLPRLEKVLGWKVSEREAERLGVKLIDGANRDGLRKSPVVEVLSRINKRYAGMKNSLQGYAGMSNLLFEALSEGTFFIYTSSTVSPREFTSTRPNDGLAREIELTRRSMARAVLNGCLCLYVRPSRLVTDYYRAWGYDQLVTPEEVKSGMASFETFTIREGTREDADGRRLTEKEARETTRSHLLQCTIDKCPMWMPGIALAMIGWLSHEEVHTAMTISLPGRHFGGILTYPPYYQLRFRYLKFCRRLCEQALHSLQPAAAREAEQEFDDKTLLKVKIEPEHRSSAEAITFFRELHRMLRATRQADEPYTRPS